MQKRKMDIYITKYYDNYKRKKKEKEKKNNFKSTLYFFTKLVHFLLDLFPFHWSATDLYMIWKDKSIFQLTISMRKILFSST